MHGAFLEPVCLFTYTRLAPEARCLRRMQRHQAMVQVPFVEVSHLASSASFYSAILQPLGLKFNNSARGPPSSVVFGAAEDPVLRVCQASETPRLSQLVFTASSRSAVLGFHDCGLRANPALRLRSLGQRQARGQRVGLVEDGGDGSTVRAAVLDLDGNRVEVVYPNPRPTMRESASAARARPSGRGEASCVVEWSRDVAASAAPPAAPQSHSSTAKQSVPRQLDAGNDSSRRRPVSPSSKSVPLLQTSGSISASTVVGALLGVAAGAALTYGIVSRGNNDADQSRRQAENPRAVSHATSAKLPETRQEDQRIAATRRIGFTHLEKNCAPVSRQGHGDGRISDRGDSRQQRYLQHPTTSKRADGKSAADKAPFRPRTVHDARSYRSTRAASARSHSEAPSERVRLSVAELDEWEGTRAPAAYRTVVTGSFHAPASPRTGYEPGRSSHGLAQAYRPPAASDQARSRASQSLSRQHERTRRSRASSLASANRSAAAPAQAVTPSSSKSQSYVSAWRTPPSESAARSYMSARRVPLPASRAPSYVSAREMPLPASDVGSSNAGWNDDMDSVAPSDSISCVGSRAEKSRRSRGRR